MPDVSWEDHAVWSIVGIIKDGPTDGSARYKDDLYGGRHYLTSSERAARAQLKPTKVVMLYGAPGAGKLTTARALQKLTGYRLFHNHLTVDLVAAVFDFGTRPFQELREQIWLDTMRLAAEERVPGLIFTFVFEPSVLPGFVERLIATLEAEGAGLLPVELACETEETLRRVRSPDRAAYLKTRDTALVRSGIEEGVYLAPYELPGTLHIDVTESPPEATAAQIARALALVE